MCSSVHQSSLLNYPLLCLEVLSSFVAMCNLFEGSCGGCGIVGHFVTIFLNMTERIVG